MKKIKIYTLPDCPHCEAVKKFLKSENTKFEEINVLDKEKAKEMIIKSQQRNVPVLDIDGEIVVRTNEDNEELINKVKAKIN